VEWSNRQVSEGRSPIQIFTRCAKWFTEAQWTSHLLWTLRQRGFTVIDVVGPVPGSELTFQGSIGAVTVDMTTRNARLVSLHELLAILQSNSTELEAVSFAILDDEQIRWKLIGRLHRLSPAEYRFVLSAAEEELTRLQHIASRAMPAHREG
jgi:hypothetical protein